MGFIWINILSGREPNLHGTYTSLSSVQMQPCHASGAECPRCCWLLPRAPGSWGCTAAASCLPLKNAVLRREVTAAQDKRSRVPAVAQEEALATALGTAGYPRGRRRLGTLVLRVQIAQLLCTALALQGAPMACGHRSRGGWCSVISAYKAPGAQGSQACCYPHCTGSTINSHPVVGCEMPLPHTKSMMPSLDCPPAPGTGQKEKDACRSTWFWKAEAFFDMRQCVDSRRAEQSSKKTRKNVQVRGP